MDLLPGLFPLQLFPQGSLESSVITTVWVGVFVVAFFNLRLGWVLSGLVVPGYIVPLLLMKPWSAGIIFTEAFITYFIVRFLSEDCSKLGYWSNLFGRDRFFAIILVSIMVRVSFDTWLLPWFGNMMENQWHITFDYRNNLHSFGLVIIALIANQLWKTGFWRGLPPLLITVLVTYIIVRYGLMEFTNFTVSNLAYMYEDLASSVLATPKAYIILITAAFIASRMNLHYGWDYNGILIPSLLALQWYQPSKIFTSFVEAFLILGVAMLLLRIPWLANRNIEGARKVLLFFNISFIYKLILAYTLLHFFPEIKVTDSYAFGYMLATLMAVKMHDKEIAARLTRATLQTSLVAVVMASFVGFFLTLLPTNNFTLQPVNMANTRSVAPINKSIIELIREDKVTLYRPRKTKGVPPPLPREMEIFSSAINHLLSYVALNEITHLLQATALLEQLRYQVYLVEDRYLYLKEQEPGNGWGIYVIDKHSKNNLLIEIPAPLEELGSLNAAALLYSKMEAKGLAIGGSRRYANADGSANVLHNQDTLYHVFHRALARRDVLQVRGYTEISVRVLGGMRRLASQIDLPELPSTMWVKASLPTSLNLIELKKLLPNLNITWDSTPLENRQRASTHSGFAELILNKTDMRKLLAQANLDKHDIPLQISEQRIDGYLQQWLLEDKNRIAGRGTNLYVSPHTEELLYFDDEILTPLWRAMQQQYRDGHWTHEGKIELRNIAIAATIMGYQLVQYQHRGTGQDYLILTEADETMRRTKARRYWGTYVFRLGATEGYIVQVPRPLYEINSFEYAVSLFERLDAKALLIAGTNPKANLDGTSDIVRIDNVESLFTLVNQVVLRESQTIPMMIIHSRAFGHRKDSATPQEDVLISLHNGKNTRTGLRPLSKNLINTLEKDGFRTRLVDGSPETAGYEVASIPQYLYLNASSNKEFAILWVSPLARTSFGAKNDNRQEQAQFHSLGIPTIEADLYTYVASLTGKTTQPEITQALHQRVQYYIEAHDVVTLRRIQNEYPSLNIIRLVDRDSRQSFMLILTDQNHLLLIANLGPRRIKKIIQVPAGKIEHPKISRFKELSAGLLAFEATP